MKKPTGAQILLILALFLAPIIGGQINTEATSLAPDLGSLLRSIISNFDSVLHNIISSYNPDPAIDTPTLSHAFIAVLAIAAAILTVAKRKVFQVPFLRVSIPLIAFMAWLVCTLAFTSFMTISVVSLAEWLSYGVVFFTVVAVAGRRRGSQYIMTAIVVACALVAIKGLLEYGAARATDPSWRVFSTWANPTSLAGMMSIGMMLALGLAVADEDITSVIPWTCGLAMACCIMVTDSRGGILSMLGGLICLSGFIYFWAPKSQSRSGIAKIAAVLVLALVFGRWVHPSSSTTHASFSMAKSPYVLAAQVSPPPAQAAPSPAAATQQVEQSSQFRFLLWKGAAILIKANPIGYGIGTYRFQSARPGLTTETQLAHNSYLQIGVEGGVLGFILFLVFLGAWMLEVVRGCYLPIRPVSILRCGAVAVGSFLLFAVFGLVSHVEVFPSTTQKIVGALGFGVLWLYVEFFRKAPPLSHLQNVMRAAIIASIVCMLFDNMLESGLYSYGIGITAFAIMGLGLVQGADGVTPEFIPKSLRVSAVVAGLLIAFAIFHAASVEVLRARARYFLNDAVARGIRTPEAQQDFVDANQIMDKAFSVAPFNIDKCDGENWRLKGDLASDLYQRVEDLKEAVTWEPNTRNYRALGMTQMLVPDYGSAIINFNHALDEDPNNLLTLPQLRNAYAAFGDIDKAVQTAQRTIDVEKTPYFQVRSLPQLIPVETYEARAFIAEHTKDYIKRADLLDQALVGYELYLKTTVPIMLQMAAAEPNVQYGGENMATVRVKMRAATQYAQELADTYKVLTNKAGEARALQMKQAFQNAIPEPGPT